MLQPYEPGTESWTGFRCGVEDAKILTGIDRVQEIGNIIDYLDNALKGNIRIWGDFMPGQIPNLDLHSKYLHRAISSAIRDEKEIFPIKNFLTESRAVKSEDEIELIKQSATISCEAMLGNVRIVDVR